MQSKSASIALFRPFIETTLESVKEPLSVKDTGAKDATCSDSEKKFVFAESRTEIFRVLHVDDDLLFLEISKQILLALNLENNSTSGQVTEAFR